MTPARLLAAFLLDLALGDPQGLPHPVRFVGGAARHLEGLVTRVLGRSRLAGAVFALTLVGGTGVLVQAVLREAARVDPRLRAGAEVTLVYTALAARDLEVESLRVLRALERGDLPEARRALSMIVGRDTDRLDEPEVLRAAVETVAESTVDGVVSPLLYAAWGERPRLWPIRRPARWTPWWAIAMTATGSSGGRRPGWTTGSTACPRGSRGCCFRWTRPSVGSTRPGAGASRGGTDTAAPVPTWGSVRPPWRARWAFGWAASTPTGGEPQVRPFLGDPLRPLERADIGRAVRLMYAVAVLTLALCVSVRNVARGGTER